MKGHLALGLVCVAFLGCSSGPGPVDRHYRLEASPPSRRLAEPALRGTLQLQHPRADALTGGRSLVYRAGAGDARFQLGRYSYERWVDPPASMLEQEIAGFLRAANAATRVLTSDSRVHPDFVLATRLLRLERVEEPIAAVVALEFTLTRSADRAVLLLETYGVEDPSASPDVAATVAHYNAALSEILERLLSSFEAAPPGA